MNVELKIKINIYLIVPKEFSNDMASLIQTKKPKNIFNINRVIFVNNIKKKKKGISLINSIICVKAPGFALFVLKFEIIFFALNIYYKLYFYFKKKILY